MSRKRGGSEGEQLGTENHRLHLASNCQVSLGPISLILSICRISPQGVPAPPGRTNVGLGRPVRYRPSGVLTGACITAHSIARTRGPRASHWPMCATGCEQPSLRGGAPPLTTLIFRIIHPRLHRLIPMVIRLILSGKI